MKFARGHLEVVKYIAKHLKNKNPADNEGSTPLHSAANFGHLKITKFLSGYLKNKNPADQNGQTPLHNAAFEGHLDVYCQIHDTSFGRQKSFQYFWIHTTLSCKRNSEF